jgi:hypothetical protein
MLAPARADERVPLSHRLNDIDSVWCDGAMVHFTGQDGTLSLDTGTARWTIDSSREYPFQSIDEERYGQLRNDSLTIWMRNAAPLATYATAQRSVTHDTTLMVLAVPMAGETAIFHQQCVLDLPGRLTHCLQYARFKAFDFDRKSIWLGGFRGIAHLERDNGGRIDYALLPMLDEHCSVYRDSIHVWIAADGIGIQRIDLRTKLLTFWGIDQLLEELHQRWKAHNSQYEKPKGKAVFTNFEPDGDDLFVACRFVRGDGSLVKQSSYLLTFSRSKQTWHAERVSRTESRDAEGVSMIRRYGQFLWLGCGHWTVWDGEHEEFGGLFLCGRPTRPSVSQPALGPLFDSDNRVHGINEKDEVHREHLVVAMAIDNGHMFVDTYKPSAGRRTTYKVNADATMTVFSDSLSGAFYNEYYQRIGHLAHRGPRALSESLLEIQVAPRVWTLPADSTEMRRH